MKTLKLTRKNLHKVANQIFETKNGYHHYTELARGDFEKNGRFCASGYLMTSFGYKVNSTINPIVLYAIVSEFEKELYTLLFNKSWSLLGKKMLESIIDTNDHADNYFDRARRIAKLIHKLADMTLADE